MGRENLSVMELSPGDVHEDDAAMQLGEALCGENLRVTPPPRDAATSSPKRRGCSATSRRPSTASTQDPDWVLSALAPNRPVLKGQVVAGFRIRPLVLEDYRVERAVAVVRGSKPFAVLPFRPLRVGLVTTGKEIVDKRVEDAFRPKLLEKLERLGGGTLMGQRFCTDSLELISEAIGAFLDEDADVIICTGGMSVDADDKTPGAIRSRCRRIAFQGTPALPGAMLMLGWGEIAEGRTRRRSHRSARLRRIRRPHRARQAAPLHIRGNRARRPRPPLGRRRPLRALRRLPLPCLLPSRREVKRTEARDMNAELLNKINQEVQNGGFGAICTVIDESAPRRAAEARRCGCAPTAQSREQ